MSTPIMEPVLQTVHLSNVIIIQDQDENYFYGIYRDFEYSIDKETTEICIKNKDNDSWDLIPNPFVILTEEVQKDILIKTAYFNSFMMNQQIANLNMEIARLHSQEIAPLKSALDQANFTISKFIQTNRGKNSMSSENSIHSLHRAQSKIEEQRIYIQKLRNELNKKDPSNVMNRPTEDDYELEVNKRIEQKCKAFVEQIEALNVRLTEKNIEFDRLNENFIAKSNEFVKLTSSLQTKESEFNKMDLEYQQFKTDYESMRSLLQSKNEEIRNLTERMNSESIMNLEKIQKMTLEMTQLNKKVKTLEKSNSELQFTPEKEAELINLRSRVSTFDSEKAQMRRTFATELENQIKERLKNSEKEIERIRVQLTEKDKELTKTKQEYKKLLKAFNEVECDYSLLKTATNTIREETRLEIENLNAQIAEKTNINSLLTDKLSRIEKQFRKALEDLQQSKKNMEGMEKNYIAVVQTFEEENNRLRYDVKAARDKVKLYHEVSNKSVEQLKTVIRREKILRNALNKYEGRPTDEESHEFVGQVVENIVRNSIDSYNKSLQTSSGESSEVYAN